MKQKSGPDNAPAEQVQAAKARGVQLGNPELAASWRYSRC
jgi:hypothetical protein